ncbi:DoxX protein [Leptolyngbya cf. ectocarpi LEGE 11479]|uniref:DoxX protein n=1 Tax=Leptolyngbya cf. ectocarpi LEGE 11479 TaxID=1828722 RepID=A0A928ZVD2_LEPEC|nr:DoxX protein [Leptolyngbya ectocarpi]MBE9068172.1 DoxX protein [Leptolyngbya cf. ectocarpi LEGE 11479]
MGNRSSLQISLAIIRFSIGLFFGVWSIEKIIHPELTQQVFETFYKVQISISLSIGIGIFQSLVILVFILGLLKTWSYGLLLGMHLVSTLSTYERLLNPYEPPNHLFWAGIPVLGAIIALFLLRDSDQFIVVKLPSSRSSAL